MVAVTAIVVIVAISCAAVGVLSADMFLLNKERKNIKTAKDQEEFDRKMLYRTGPRTPFFYTPL